MFVLCTWDDTIDDGGCVQQTTVGDDGVDFAEECQLATKAAMAYFGTDVSMQHYGDGSHDVLKNGVHVGTITYGYMS